jgi:hypothetical protein
MTETQAGAEGASASDASQPAASSADTPSQSAPDTSASSSTPTEADLVASHYGVTEGDAPPSPRARDDRGRFAKAGESPEVAPQGDAPVQAAPGAAPAAAAPAPQKFKLAEGLEFDSPEQAAQQIRTMRGMFKSQDTQIRDLRSELTQAINVANAWKARAEGSAATAAPGTTPSPAAAPASGKPATLAEPDWELLHHLASNPEVGLTGAMMQYHQEQNRLAEAREQKLREEIAKEFESKFAPVLSAHSEQAELAEVDALVRNMASWTVQATGAPAFPELQDVESIAAVGQTWRDAGNDPKLLKTPQGLQMAVALHRMWSGYTAPQPSVAAAPSTAPMAPAPPPPPGSTDLALAMAGSAPPHSRPSGPAHPQAAVRHAIRNADVMDAHFGVAP